MVDERDVFETNVNTDGRKQYDWESKYPECAQKEMKKEAIYIAIILIIQAASWDSGPEPAERLRTAGTTEVCRPPMERHGSERPAASWRSCTMLMRIMSTT